MIKINIKKILEYLLCILIIINCRTVFVHIPETKITDIVNILIVSVIISLTFFSVNRNTTKKTILSIYIYFLYILIYFILKVSDSKISFIMKFIIIIPLLYYYFMGINKEEKRGLLKKYFKIIYILTIISLFFYILGSFMKIIPINTHISIEWGSIQEIEGYFGLHFNTQKTHILDRYILRNTSIFTEGPMFALQIIIAYTIILFENKKLINKESIVLFIGIITTLSLTGIFIFIILSLLKKLESIQEIRNFKNSVYLRIFMIPIIIIAFIIGMYLFNDKKETRSYQIKNDDNRVTMIAFNENPVFGEGYLKQEIALSNMSEFRHYNMGLSSNFLIIIIQGGIYLSILYIVPMLIGMLKAYRNKEKKELVLFLTQILLYFNVPYQYTILMMFLIAYNIAYIVSDEKKKD